MAVLTRGERFKDARNTLNQHGKQTMKAVEQATGVSASLIKDLEDDNSKRSVGYDKVAALAKHYGVSANWLLELSDDPAMQPSAVDDLGLPPEVIAGITRFNENEDYESSHEALCKFLEYTVNSPFFEMISVLSSMVDEEMEAPARWQTLANLEESEWRDDEERDLPFGQPENMHEYFHNPQRYERSSTTDIERMTGCHLAQQLGKINPEVKGRIKVIFGGCRLEPEASVICSYFRRCLEQITGYKEYLDNWM